MIYFRDLMIPNQCFFWCKILHYHDLKTNFSEKDMNNFVGRNMPKLPDFERKKGLKLLYWLLKFGSFLSFLLWIISPPNSQNWKKKEDKTMLLTTEILQHNMQLLSPFTGLNRQKNKKLILKSPVLLAGYCFFFQNQLSRLFYILYFWITGYQYNWLKK